MHGPAVGKKTMWVIAIVSSVAIAISFAAGGIALAQRFHETNARRATQAEINLAVCSAAANDRKSLRALVIQADAQLGTPKSAGYQYYRTHPDELAAAHAQTQKNLAEFLPVIKCAPSGKPYQTTTENRHPRR